MLHFSVQSHVILISVFGVFIFVLGACIGSFLNVCIWRIPRGESIVFPPSHCRKCGRRLSWPENIPLISWIILGGKCRSCREPISPRYFWVELLTACLFFIVWLKISAGTQNITLMIPYFFITMLVILTVFIDAEHRIIPNEITYTAVLAGLIFSLIWPCHWGVLRRMPALALSVGSFAVSFGVMAILAVFGRFFFKRESLGWGDVKYLGAVGACLGLPASFFTLLFGSLAGSLYGLSLIAFGRGKLKTATIPFGPFLGAGTYIWIVFGEKILSAYLKLSKMLALKIGMGG